MTMELRHLRAFLAIAEEGTITRAATRLHTGQPALSRTLRQLETHLGVRLVDRSTHHLELTAAGRAFRDQAAAALAAVDTAFDPRSLAALPLRLGHPWAALGDLTLPLLRRWDEEHPGVPLELRRVDDRTAGLTRGKVDVALLRGELTAPDLVTELLMREERVAVVPADSDLTARDALTLADLTPWPIALNTVAGTTTLDLWSTAARPEVVIEVTNTDEWLTAIAAGRAVGISTSATPRMHTHPAIAYRPLTDAPPVPLVLAWHRGTPAHPAIPDLIRLAHELVAER
ncbi:LysR family transcriptional regulator [Streptomyces flavofungini]|uniref:LysR family transcriptional regulator n=1 Tax=Streptomyces flavofungini TaxID=68200 RepID=A0ABS0X875_9ACTN|nr:LysR family transcriptional regulator [Streptomyces flavofungini]MBJ3809413.1 LysR family transcriptional regulator [Streptomyces flavofungini]GHC78139.1 LysR family transcriptional regulator [Streptomyces flavofungini]